MANNQRFTEDTIERRKREGRGTGEDSTWNPWIHRGDLNSSGTQSLEALEGAGGRLVHTLSNGETRFFQAYMASPGVDFIHEQTPLDRERTRRIARELGIAHPRDTDSNIDIVMTTDLVVYLQPDATNERVRLARSVKPAASYTQGRSSYNHIEHAEIERRYWAEEGVDWSFVVPEMLPTVFVENLATLHIHRDWHRRPEPLGYEGSYGYMCNEVLASVLGATRDAALSSHCAALNDRHGWPSGNATGIALHLIKLRQLKADIKEQPLLKQSVLSIAQATLAVDADAGPRSIGRVA